MDECCNIKTLLTPSAAAGIVLLTGAAELVMETVLDLGIETDYFQREVAPDGAGVTCVNVQLKDEQPEQVSLRIRTALANLVEQTQELAGWTFSVSLAEAPDDV
jgi:hypothetical protein